MARRKQHSEPHEEHADETWLIPYSELLTLLLALFIVLFASSSLDKGKAAQMEYAMAAAFNAIPSEQMNGTVFLTTPKTWIWAKASDLVPIPKARFSTLPTSTFLNRARPALPPRASAC